SLGRPTGVLLPRHLTDWRWLQGRSDTPWYPGVMRLFRQTQPGDWAGPVQALADALGQGLAGALGPGRLSPGAAPWAPGSAAA
ncbi:MAG: hypothetical protein KGL50_05735, partial [Burkholderiales bacterium]|nr:hypothetical protein [Burkholderiales bacterium]